ncbi:class I SAM-dependent methyltransferase [Undibacterium arcticum]|uniref:Class I SAM-dependent methyltransferase n=1 Tax=Undibacterium arcticum TaxID=1762892 RepID=A0ABV7F4S6_9BURK
MTTPEQADLAHYYAQRAQSYESVYDKPERQADLAQLRQQVAETMRGHDVLELACGTGYWTAQFAASANSVLATDISPELLDIAKAKHLPADKVQFALADVFHLPSDFSQRGFSACFAGFWWSHLKRQDQAGFLADLRAKLGAGSLLVMIDNCYVEGSSSPIARTDLEGNTYQLRSLQDGRRIEVVKNFPSDSTLRKKLGPAVRDIRILRMEYFWMLSCRLK